MAEPSITTAVALSASVGFISMFPGIDGNALIGAFAGAALVVVTANDVGVWRRCAYLFISLIAGYLGAPEILNITPIKSSGVAAFFAASLAIVVTLQLIERVKTFDFFSMLRKGK